MLGTHQLDIIEEHMHRTLQKRLQRVIVATFPELNHADASEIPADRVGALVQRGIESAVKYGIGDAPDFAAFIALGLALRGVPPGTSNDWIKSWLERPDTPGGTKLAVIEAQLRDMQADPALLVVIERVAQARREAEAP